MTSQNPVGGDFYPKIRHSQRTVVKDRILNCFAKFDSAVQQVFSSANASA